MEDRLTRKLAAILYADVTDYSRLTGEDEDGTHRQLSQCLDLISDIVAVHNGSVVHYAGDAILADFSTVSDALKCAVTAQDRVKEENKEFKVERRLQFRMGINLGEVIVDRGDIYGDGVNVAARLEGLAQPGGICISEAVRSAIGARLPYSYGFEGEQTVKNIVEPVRVYSVNWDGQQTHHTLNQEVLERPAVAVLPFTNMSEDAEQEYFVDGLTEDIITGLSAWHVFPVIARNSTFTYKGRSVQVKQVSQELNARYVLEGSVRKGGNRVRVTAQLIDGENEHHIWAKRFDRELVDIFELQDELTQSIITTIVPKLDKVETKRSSNKRKEDLDAWDYYLRGMALIHEYTNQANMKAREMFDSAIALQPDYADAYSGLALSYLRDILLQSTGDREDTVVKALDASRQAVKLDDSSSMAHHVLSTALQWRNEHEAALASARRAVDLNPNDAIALHALGNKSDLVGDSDGIVYMETAHELNPEDPQSPSHLAFVARAYVNAGDFQSAMDRARKAIQRKPDYPHAYFILAIALGHLDRIDEGRQALKQCEAAHPGFVKAREDWQPYVDPESNQKLMEGLRKLAANG